MAKSATRARWILVVEDEALVFDSVTSLLLSFGYEVEVAFKAPADLSLFEKDKFDLIVVDYLTSAMNRDELAAIIKARATGQPIVMIATSAEMLDLPASRWREWISSSASLFFWKTSPPPLSGVERKKAR